MRERSLLAQKIAQQAGPLLDRAIFSSSPSSITLTTKEAELFQQYMERIYGQIRKELNLQAPPISGSWPISKGSARFVRTPIYPENGQTLQGPTNTFQNSVEIPLRKGVLFKVIQQEIDDRRSLSQVVVHGNVGVAVFTPSS